MKIKTLFILILLLAYSGNAMAYDFMVGGLCYDICTDNESVAVTYESRYSDNYEELQGNIVIPRQVNYSDKTYEVVMIGHDAFRDCSGLTSVTIPNSVRTIATDAFYYCSSLSTIMIPESVTKIGFGVFGGCLNLISIYVDPLNTTFDSRENCDAIIETATNSLIVGCKNTQVPTSIKTIAPSAFYKCSGLLTLTIPDSVTEIGSSAFYGCTGLAMVNIPPSVTEIGSMAFYGCTELATVNIPPSVTEIGSSAFYGCTGLATVNIPPSVTEIGSSAFYGCTELASVNIPPSVAKIDDYTFYRCTGLTSVTIPNSVTTIGRSAFYGCTGLAAVNIPPSVTKIGRSAFCGCTGLTAVNIPTGVTEIGYTTFKDCIGLTSVVIPYSVKKIDSEAFGNCTNLKAIISSISTPQNTNTDFTAFRGVDRQTCHLVVPQGSLESYSSVSPWLYFANKSEDASLVCSQTQMQSADIQESLSFEELFQLYCDEQQYDKAIDIGERLMAEPDSKQVDNHMIKKLADCYYKIKDFGKAKEYYETLVRDNSDNFANEMLGDCCMNMNDYVSAEKYYLQAYNHLLSDTTTTTASSTQLLQKIHDCYFAQGKFLEAADAFCSEHQSKIGPATAEGKMTLVLHLFLNRSKEMALEISLMRIKKTGDNLYNQGLYDEAQDLYANAIVYFQKIRGVESYEEAVINERIGRCYLMMQQYSLAHDYLNRSKKIFEKEGTNTINSYLGLNRYLSEKRIKAILNKLTFNELYTALGVLHPMYGMYGILSRKQILAEDLILDYGIYYASQCIVDSSYAYLGSSIDRIYDKSIDFLGNNTSADRSAYWEKNSHLFSETYPYVVLMAAEEYKSMEEANSSYSDLYGDLYNKSALFAKGLLLTSDNEFSRIIYESGDSILISRYKELEALKNISEPLTDEQLQIVTDKATKIEKELLVLSKDYNEFMANLQLTWQDVQARLGDNDIAVEFLSFPKLGTDSIYYIALTLRKKYDMPHLVFLGEQRELEVAVERAYSSKELSQIIWGQIAEHCEYEHVLDSNLGISKKGELEGVKNIYFSPSGELHTVAIESIPHWEKTDSLMSECYNIYRLSSTRELVINRKDFNASGAAVYGGIEYNASVASMGSTPRKIADSSSYYARHHGFDIDSSSDYAQRGFDADSAGYRGKIWADLKYAQLEADSITSILNDKKIDVVKRSRDAATETSFKNLSGERKRIIHIATHGFCWSEAAAQHKSRNKQLSFLSGQNPEDKAMTRTGLLFSGANHCFADGNDSTDVIPEGVDDGVLTAREVSTLDLRGLDLLVLSACQTGQGEINSEGVFGLQRGFKKAGVQSIIMSLWTVNDRATSDMMMLFYHYYTGGMSKHDAFLMAQKDIRNKYGNYKDEKHIIPTDKPHWAAFILLDAIDN